MIYSRVVDGTKQSENRTKIQKNNLWYLSPQWVKETMKTFIEPLDWSEIVNAIQTGTCVGVTDRYFDPCTHIATACWIIEGLLAHRRAKGATQTPGNKDK